MGYKSYKVIIPPKSTSGATNENNYCDIVLGHLKDTFIASGKWELETDCENIGTNSENDYGTRTLQLHSTVTNGPHLRIWYFSYSVLGNWVEVDTDSGDATSIKIHKDNIFKCDSESYSNYCLLPSGLIFGVSDSSIGADLGYALDLKVPLFSVRTDYTSLSSDATISDNAVHDYGATVSVITDGLMFGIIESYNSSGSDEWRGCVYAPDMMVCANADDAYTAGVVGTRGVHNFYFGDNDTDTGEYTVSLFSSKTGSFDFSGLTQGINCGRSPLKGAQSSTKMLTAPLSVFMYPYTYSGSSATGITDGISLKGWLNTKYVRGAHLEVLPFAMKGSTFASGEWICMNTGTLLCWDSTNSNPFDDSV